MRGLEDLLTCSLKEEIGFNRKQILLEGCVSGGGMIYSRQGSLGFWK